MTGARHESPRLVRDRIVRRIRKGTQGTVSDIRPVRVDIVLRPRSGVLEIVPPFVLCHPGAFDVGADGIAVIGTKPLPAVPVRVKGEEGLRAIDVCQSLCAVKFDPVDGVDIRRAEVHVPPVRPIIVEQVRIPRTEGPGEGREERVKVLQMPVLRRRCEVDRTPFKRRLEQIERVTDRKNCGGAHVFFRPHGRPHKFPVEKVGRTPPAARIRDEEKVCVTMVDDNRISARAIRYPLFGLFDAVLVVDIDRIAPGLLTGKL